jgi:hypothetical protein
MKFQILFTLVFCLISVGAWAQGMMIKINYAPSMPLGNTADFTSNFSGRGANFEFLKMSDNRFGFGVEAGTVNFYEEVPDQLLESGTVTVHGNQFRYMKMTPLMASAIFFFTESGPIRPFASLAAGLSINTRTRNMGVFVEKVANNQIAFRPELGAVVELSDYVGIKVSGKYYQTFENSAMPSQSWLGFNVGFVMLNFNN